MIQTQESICNKYLHDDWQVFSIHKTKLSFKNCCRDTISPDMLSLLLFRSHPIHKNTLSACVPILPLVFQTRQGLWVPESRHTTMGTWNGPKVESEPDAWWIHQLFEPFIELSVIRLWCYLWAVSGPHCCMFTFRRTENSYRGRDIWRKVPVRYSSFLALHKGIIWWWLGCVWRIEKRKIRERERAKVKVWCWNAYSVCSQNDSDLDFSSSSEYRASTKPCGASSLFKVLN